MAPQRSTKRIPFVEDKPPDFQNVIKHLARSERHNHWTNFGPVWEALKRHLETMLELPPGRCVVPTASGTHALMAAAALAERHGPLRWVSPDFAFRATAVGAFSDARVVDCNKHGCLDVELLQLIAKDTYDAVVVLNPFGLLEDMNAIVEFTQRLGKAMIIDNAMGLVGFDRRDHGGVLECISLHHTKPFGFGEGGCLILDRDLEGDAKRALDFGYGWQWPAGGSSLSNGKLSEPSAAFILDRLEKAPSYVAGYRLQFERIRKLGERHGFCLLVDDGELGQRVPGSVPLLSNMAISLDEVSNELVAVAKYYRPISGMVNASEIYSRIVNIPCHPGMALLSDHQISGLFERWRN